MKGKGQGAGCFFRKDFFQYRPMRRHYFTNACLSLVKKKLTRSLAHYISSKISTQGTCNSFADRLFGVGGISGDNDVTPVQLVQA